MVLDYYHLTETGDFDWTVGTCEGPAHTTQEFGDAEVIVAPGEYVEAHPMFDGGTNEGIRWAILAWSADQD